MIHHIHNDVIYYAKHKITSVNTWHGWALCELDLQMREVVMNNQFKWLLILNELSIITKRDQKYITVIANMAATWAVDLLALAPWAVRQCYVCCLVSQGAKVSMVVPLPTPA
jgi:hypothetical protein